MTEEQIKYMVDRFLQWKLPNPFRPDNHISFTPSDYQASGVHPWPSGTNLFDATQATDMVRFMLEGLPDSAEPEAPTAKSSAIALALDQARRKPVEPLKTTFGDPAPPSADPGPVEARVGVDTEEQNDGA